MGVISTIDFFLKGSLDYFIEPDELLKLQIIIRRQYLIKKYQTGVKIRSVNQSVESNIKAKYIYKGF